MTLRIYHNPRCSKSRQTLQLLRDRGLDPEIVEYLKHPPSAVVLDGLLRAMGMQPRDLMRRKEAPFKELNLDDPALTRGELVMAMVEHPILIERPIVVNGDRVALGRPPEAVLHIL
ncbi:MAG: arsenate reductase (glutaredoxin) [Thalassobaculum sp.]|uniref:arsenate reductase (glutaredoxin) n=1 Tax=Thalassobaculum sp. TaxID=2022740 RepID=UPI0032EE2DBE